MKQNVTSLFASWPSGAELRHLIERWRVYLNNVSLSQTPPGGHSHLVPVQLLHG